MLSRIYKPNAQSGTVYPKPKRVSEGKPMPYARAIYPDPQSISEATNKRAPGSYLNKGGIVRVWRAAPFSTVRETGAGWAGSCILYDIFIFPANKGRRGREQREAGDDYLIYIVWYIIY